MKHLLIDFENIQPQNLDKLPTEADTHIWLFLGVVHKALPVSLVKSLLRFGERAHLVQLQKTGKNALDFYLSYYLGQITAIDSDAQIGVLSRDGGFDVLVEHILENGQAQNIVRLADIGEVQHEEIHASVPKPLAGVPSETKPTPVHSLAPYFQAALTALRQPDAFRPCRLNNLQQNLHKYILHDLYSGKTEEQCQATTAAVINKLKSQKLISVDEHETVSYHISDADLLEKIQRCILSQRPKTYAEFQVAVQNRAEAVCLKISQGDIQKFAQYLSKQNLIRQGGGKIEYAPFAEPKVQPVPKPPENYQPEETVWKKVIAALSVAKNKRPSKVSALHNTIKAHAKCGEAEISKLVQHLQEQKILRIEGTKIVYLK
ncbi:PIN domain-containing protein [Neisseria sp.]|uniref:PIN domain-containing protein n=1 Tax=Neisseria sp. TaxID=192066 RepID=UPI0026DC5330|nr:PIN domain-containing protein [Neisseria sp.]MDO4228105.1 PIN domain-containing protein [Neisseria sp.]